MHRISRTLHRGSNLARVTAYTADLRAVFSSWTDHVDEKGYSSGALIRELDRSAQRHYPQAFANGRHQAYPKRRPSASGQEILKQRILLNRHYLQNSLQPALDERVQKWRANNESTPLSEALQSSFGARIDMYGGSIWPVTETGYRAGVDQARHDLAIRLTGHLMAEEGDDEEPEPGDHALAIALGLTVVGLMLLLRRGRTRAGTRTPPPQTSAGLGPRTAEPIASSVATVEPDTEMGQIIPLFGVLERSGIRVGTAYVAEDGACDPCVQNVGTYYDQDPPLPGDDCDGGSGRCRCHLETEVEEVAQAA